MSSEDESSMKLIYIFCFSIVCNCFDLLRSPCRKHSVTPPPRWITWSTGRRRGSCPLCCWGPFLRPLWSPHPPWRHFWPFPSLYTATGMYHIYGSLWTSKIIQTNILISENILSFHQFNRTQPLVCHKCFVALMLLYGLCY